LYQHSLAHPRVRRNGPRRPATARRRPRPVQAV